MAVDRKRFTFHSFGAEEYKPKPILLWLHLQSNWILRWRPVTFPGYARLTHWRSNLKIAQAVFERSYRGLINTKWRNRKTEHA